MSKLNINDRIFGDDIPPKIKKKLQYRQAFAKNSNPNEEIRKIDAESDDLNYSVDDYFTESNFKGLTDLSSRTPFARLWTALQVKKRDATPWTDTSKKPIKGEDYEPEKGEIYDEDRNTILSAPYPTSNIKIYQIGNHVLNTLSVGASVELNTLDNSTGLTYEHFLPSEQRTVSTVNGSVSTQDNEFFRPSTGITSINSSTEGIGLVKKTTVNFIVSNFHDFDKIYSKYFLRPGAPMVIDFGWDTSTLYNPIDIADSTKRASLNRGTTINDVLFNKQNGIISESTGDMETLAGFVVNYDAKVKDDGSVECSIEISSRNSALLSYDFNDATTFRTRVFDNLDRHLVDRLGKLFEYKKDEPGKRNLYDLLTRDPEYKQAAMPLISRFSNSIDNQPSRAAPHEGIYWHLEDDSEISDTSNVYMSIGLFEDLILNKQLGFVDPDEDKFLEATWDSYNSVATYDENLLFRQKSVVRDLGKNLNWLYPKWWGNEGKSGDGELSYSAKQPGKLGYPQIGNISIGPNDDRQLGIIPIREIFISVSLIKKSFKGSNTIKDAVQKILDAINENSNDIFDFKISSSDVMSNRCSIIDNNCPIIEKYGEIFESTTPGSSGYLDQLFEFNPMSPTSIVKGYSLSLETPSDEFQSMLAIKSSDYGQMNIPFDSLMDKYISMNEMDAEDLENTGVTYTLGLNDNSIRQNEVTDEDVLAAYNQMEGKTIYAPQFWEKTSDGYYKQKHLESPYTLRGKEKLDLIKSDPDHLYNNTISLGNDIQTAEPPPSDEETVELNTVNSVFDYYSVLARGGFLKKSMSIPLPLTLSLDIYGISGIVPGNCIRVDYIPERYRNIIYFQVMKVNHSLDNSTWTTSFECKHRLISNRKKSFKIIQKDIAISTKFLKDSLKLRNIGEFTKYIRRLKPVDFKSRSGYTNTDKVDYVFRFKANNIQGRNGKTITYKESVPFISVPIEIIGETANVDSFEYQDDIGGEIKYFEKSSESTDINKTPISKISMFMLNNYEYDLIIYENNWVISKSNDEVAYKYFANYMSFYTDSTVPESSKSREIKEILDKRIAEEKLYGPHQSHTDNTGKTKISNSSLQVDNTSGAVVVPIGAGYYDGPTITYRDSNSNVIKTKKILYE